MLRFWAYFTLKKMKLQSMKGEQTRGQRQHWKTECVVGADAGERSTLGRESEVAPFLILATDSQLCTNL